MNITVRIVLVRPRNPLNIGAAARAMANFGYSKLFVVSPYEPVWDEAVSAVGAEKIIGGATVVPSLQEAIAGCHFVLGTTSGQKRSLDRDIINLPDIRKSLEVLPGMGSNFELGVVFGPEKTGLTNKHLARCNAILTVPTSPDTPSMNLGQAVAVCCYELSRITGGTDAPVRGEVALPTSDEIDIAVGEIEALFKKTGFQKGCREDVRVERARKLLFELKISRANLFFIRALVERVLEKERS